MPFVGTGGCGGAIDDSFFDAVLAGDRVYVRDPLLISHPISALMDAMLNTDPSERVSVTDVVHMVHAW